MSEQQQPHPGRLIIVSAIILAVVVILTGCKKQPAEQTQTEHHRHNPTQSEPIGGSPVKPARPDTGITTGSKVGLNGIGLVESLTKDSFLQKVFNYEQNKEWKFEGKLPCIIDFYADWCAPCKMVEPILQELAQEYQGKLNIYRVDTQAQQELAAAFGIQSIPSMLFVPLNDKPQMAIGALPKKTLKKAIKEVLKVE
jgi:thioredoxin